MLMSMAFIVMSRLMSVKTEQFDQVDAQYSMLAADAFLADIYSDFHVSNSFSFETSPAGQILLMFEKEDGSSSIYSYNPSEMMCYKDGVPQFRAQRFDVVGAVNNLIVSLKLQDERLLEISVHR